jgi:hypothetical protein
MGEGYNPIVITKNSAGAILAESIGVDASASLMPSDSRLS